VERLSLVFADEDRQGEVRRQVDEEHEDRAHCRGLGEEVDRVERDGLALQAVEDRPHADDPE